MLENNFVYIGIGTYLYIFELLLYLIVKNLYYIFKDFEQQKIIYKNI